MSLQGDLVAVENYKWGNKDGLQEYLLPSGERLGRKAGWPLTPRTHTIR